MRYFILLALLFSGCTGGNKLVNAPDSKPLSYPEEIRQYQNELNDLYRDRETSPLLEEDFENFQTLDFYPINSKYRVEAKFKLTPDEKPFQMQTSTTRLPVYKKFGEAKFSIEGSTYKLDVFQNQSPMQPEEYKNYLFIPFKDLTCGEGSYGGGRYIDLKEHPDNDKVVIDFNRAYNPYCAYSHKYSCPIPPKENHLDVTIPAGVMDFKPH